MQFLVIADDFTGANDTGVQLAKKGTRVDVSFNWQQLYPKQVDVVVINTESRALTAQEASQRINTCIVAQKPFMSKTTAVYKKIDSTFRGNVGAEIEAALWATQAKLALVAAAIPAAGRVTKNGNCYVHGTPLLETEFSRDPKTPIFSSNIKEIIASQTQLPIYELGLADIHSSQYVEKLNQLAQWGPAIVVLDAQTEDDLQQITSGLKDITQRYILVGAAGLANALPVSIYKSQKANPPPMLIVAGSMSETTRKQIDYVITQRKDIELIDIDVECLLSEQCSTEIERIVDEAIQILSSKKHCILSSCKDDKVRENIRVLMERYQFSRQQLGDKISQHLGMLTEKIVSQCEVGGLFLTGGDIAIAVAKALNATGYQIKQEVMPCIPCGFLLGCQFSNVPVITKAGGFGDDTTLQNSLVFLERMYCEEQ